MDTDQIDINFFSQSLILKIIDKTFFKHLLQTVLFVFQNNCSSSSGMNSSDNIWEVALKFVNVSNSLINVLLNFSDNFFQLLIINWEIVLENSDSLFASFCENNCDFVNEINFRDKHSSEHRTN